MRRVSRNNVSVGLQSRLCNGLIPDVLHLRVLGFAIPIPELFPATAARLIEPVLLGPNVPPPHARLRRTLRALGRHANVTSRWARATEKTTVVGSEEERVTGRTVGIVARLERVTLEGDHLKDGFEKSLTNYWTYQPH
jgi:hypothetical protein